MVQVYFSFLFYFGGNWPPFEWGHWYPLFQTWNGCSITWALFSAAHNGCQSSLTRLELNLATSHTTHECCSWAALARHGSDLDSVVPLALFLDTILNAAHNVPTFYMLTKTIIKYMVTGVKYSSEVPEYINNRCLFTELSTAFQYLHGIPLNDVKMFQVRDSRNPIRGLIPLKFWITGDTPSSSHNSVCRKQWYFWSKCVQQNRGWKKWRMLLPFGKYTIDRVLHIVAVLIWIQGLNSHNIPEQYIVLYHDEMRIDPERKCRVTYWPT